MSNGNTTMAYIKEPSTLARPIFSPGMLLQHEDLEQLTVYTRELSRLLFRSLFGCGVVCGLLVKAEVDHCNKVFVTVEAGLALDCSGDPVHVLADKRFALDGICYPDLPKNLWVVLCRTTKNCAPRTSMCADDDDTTTSVCTRERDMFEIRVVSQRPSCVCGCAEPSSAASSPPAGTTYSALQGSPIQPRSQDPCLCADPNLDCHKYHYDGTCGCNCGGGSDCGCGCILLARLDKTEKEPGWTADHRVRRFIRPVLMRDPLVEKEEGARTVATQETLYAKELAAAQEDARVAYKVADQRAEAAYKAAYEANAAAEFQANKLALAQSAAAVLKDKKAAEDKAKRNADRTKAAADKAANAGDKTAPEKAAASAEAAVELERATAEAQEAAAEAARTDAEAKEAAAEAERTDAEAKAAGAAASEAAEYGRAADLAVASATEKLERFQRERMLPRVR
jgi:hypothetical protein